VLDVDMVPPHVLPSEFFVTVSTLELFDVAMGPRV